MKRVVILGSSGSIGKNTLEVISHLPNQFQVLGLAVHSNIKDLDRQVERFHPPVVAVGDIKRAVEFRRKKRGFGLEVLEGEEGIEKIASFKDADLVVVAISKAAALKPLLSAVDAGKRIALANKEALVIAGSAIMDKAKSKNSCIIPIDSEQSAIWQIFDSQAQSELKKIYLTASGGALRDISSRRFKDISPPEVLNHPRWKMGSKTTVDSATLMNKGLEVIETCRLFDVEIDKIDVLIHRQAIVHSMVEFQDGVVFAQLGITDMKLPIQYALTYPKRYPLYAGALDFKKIDSLSFSLPDKKRFPCLDLAYEAGRVNGTHPAVLNAANEVAVEAFLDNRLGFSEIPKLIERVLEKHHTTTKPALSQILKADGWARTEARRIIASKCFS